MFSLAVALVFQYRFNPCFNGFMDKDTEKQMLDTVLRRVSTLVLMDSWIKTHPIQTTTFGLWLFQPLF